MRFSEKKMRAMFAVLVVSVVTADAPAQPAPQADVVAVAGAGAQRKSNGAAFLPVSPGGTFKLRADSGMVPLGEGVVTPPDGSAVVSLANFGVVVLVAQRTQLLLDRLPVVDSCVPARLVLADGRMHVATRGDSNLWLVVDFAGAGYALSKGATYKAAIVEGVAEIRVVRGEVIYFTAPRPGEALIDGNGRPIRKDGVSTMGGQSISSVNPDQVTPVVETGERDVGMEAFSNTFLGFGRFVGERWIVNAEKGDFTPVRGPGRGRPEIAISAELSTSFAFDQPRSGVVAPTRAAAAPAVRSAQISRAQQLQASLRPAEVIIGRRLGFSRFLGGPGQGLRANSAALRPIVIGSP